MIGAAATSLGTLATPYFNTRALAQASLEGKRVGYSMSFSTIEWLVAQRREVETAAEALGLELSISDALSNPSKQVLDLEDFLTRQMDLVIISTYYADAITVPVQELNAAGIPIVVLSSSLAGGADWTSRLATDTLTTATAAGNLYVDMLAPGSKVVHIEGRPGSTINQERSKGWSDVIEASDLEVVGRQVANYERTLALRAMEDFLQANRQIDAAYCNNDDMALGAMQAAREAGRLEGMMFTGYDGIQPEVMQAIHSGEMYGTWRYAPMGTEGVRVAAAILSGQEVSKEYLFPSPLITRENVEEYWNPETNEMRSAPSSLEL